MNEDLTKRLPGQSDGKLDELFQVVQAIRADLSDLRRTVETLGSTVETLGSTVEALGSTVQTLGSTVEARLHDTRPMWEKVNADITQLQEGQHHLVEGQQHLVEGQQRLEAGQEFLGGEVREIRTSLRDMNRKFSIFNDTLVSMQADYRDIYDRVRGIEQQRA